MTGLPMQDCFTTASDLGMTTTCGSLAFVGAKTSKNATIVQRMIDGGLIILAKANMTEFCGMKMTYMMPGWSAHGGQTLSPYVPVIEKDEKILGHSVCIYKKKEKGKRKEEKKTKTKIFSKMPRNTFLIT